MSSAWNSKYAILEDLSLAQGCVVPADLESTIRAGDKPPALKVDEEDDYFDHYFADYQQGNGYTAPDCGLILQMLEMVQGTDDVTEIVDQNKTTECENVSYNDNVKKSKPRNVVLLNAQPSSMFKKKNVQKTKANETIDGKNVPVTQKSVTCVNTYQPSTRADKYCQEFIERNKMNEVIKDDVWSRAMKVMQEIDLKKKLEAEARPKADAVAATTSAMNAMRLTGGQETFSESNVQFVAIDKMSPPPPEFFTLPQHRHLLTGECLVCNVFKKNGINIDFQALIDNASDNFTLAPIN